MTQVLINGNSYSDDGSTSRSMPAGGHKTWLLPMLADTMVRVGAAETAATNAAASASAAAASAANLVGSSTTSVTIGTGSKNFTASTGRQWGVGQWLIVVDAANIANTMTGQITAYNSGTGALTISVPTGGTSGSGTIASWNIFVSGQQGAKGDIGLTGAPGSSLTSATIAANTTLLAADSNKFIDVTATCTITLSAPATLGSTWWTFLRNNGASGTLVTLSHTSGNVDGVSSFVMYEGEVRLLRCNGSTVLTTVIQPFRRFLTASGSMTMPPGYRKIGHDIMGGGAGGGAGGRISSGSETGGPGGPGGGRSVGVIDSPTVATSITLNVGSGGSGAAARTTDGVATAGNSGSASSIVWGGITRAYAGGGTVSSINNNTGGGVGAADYVSTSGAVTMMGGIGAGVASPANAKSGEWGGGSGASASTAGNSGVAGGSSVFGGPGGGGGGGSGANNGGAGGKRGQYTTGGGGAGGTGGGAGGTATDSGGGGGAGSSSANAGAGGNGTGYGAGGGGGGGVVGAFNSGPGGNGNGGYCDVWGVL